MLNKFVDKLQTDRLKTFAINLLTYIQKTWILGFRMANWNLFDVNLEAIPATNNGNESANARLNNLFLTHPQVYEFAYQLAGEFFTQETKVDGILMGEVRPKGSIYDKLKNEREAAKTILVSRLAR